MFRKLISKWKQYRYRFVPWIAITFKNRSVRQVDCGSLDKIISDEKVLQSLIRLFTAFENGTPYNTVSIEESNSGALYCKGTVTTPAEDAWEIYHQQQVTSKDEQRMVYHRNLSIMRKEFGFCIERKQSSIQGGGTGVFVTDGCVPQGHVVALYPGVVYEPYDPILLQSISNSFIFRCVDSILIDGNDKALSKIMCKSCCQRDRVGPYFTADMTWLTESPLCPLSVGQYVNNQSKEFPANVAYQELDISEDFPFHLQKYIPNVNYAMNVQTQELHNHSNRVVRTVALVSTRDIKRGEELYSTYFTVVH